MAADRPTKSNQMNLTKAPTIHKCSHVLFWKIHTLNTIHCLAKNHWKEKKNESVMRKKVASCTFTVELYMESIDYMSSHPPPFGMLEGIISAVVNVGRT